MEEINAHIGTLIIATVFILVFILAFFAFMFFYFKRFYRLQAERESLKLEMKNELSRARLEIQEEVFRHISYELHDNLGQVASLIKIHLNTIDLNNPEKSKQKIADTKELIRQLISDIKLLSVNLNNESITQKGLLHALETTLHHIQRTGIFETSLEVDGEFENITNDKTIILFRMCQEVINNIVKHSKATQLKIIVTNSDNYLSLKLSDNGIGFNAKQQLFTTGSGLKNLKHRARLIKASIQFESKFGEGTTVHIKLPV